MTESVSSAFLDSCDVIDWRRDNVRALASGLTAGKERVDAARALFEWVRDNVAHTADAGHGALTMRASEVLRERTGLCYAKSHLLVALLRAAGIPAGLCYQRLRLDDDGAAFALHGMAAVLMPDGAFFRIDPRGNKPGIDTRFLPDRETLAYRATAVGELELPGVFALPVPAVVRALSAAKEWSPQTLLPDAQLRDWPAAEASYRTPGDP